MSALIPAAICFIASHGGPADHFATFVENLPKGMGPVEIYASGPALKKFQERKIAVKEAFSLDQISSDQEDALAESIAKACSAAIIITDVGHPFSIKVHKALERNNHTRHWVYYDNPEDLVEGGYSAVAARVILASRGKVLFANAHLANTPIFESPGKEIDFGSHEKVGIGYYPVEQADKIAKRREKEGRSVREAIFAKYGLVDRGQKVLVYFGGNNVEYFSRAFPAFLSLLDQAMQVSDLSDLVIVFQQHPGAKSTNKDVDVLVDWIINGSLTNMPKLIVSDFSSDDAQVIADAAFYYQTSMGPQFALEGITTVQIGHKPYNDVLVRNGITPSVTKIDQLLNVIEGLSGPKNEVQREVVLEALGYKTNWLSILETTLKRK